MSASPQLPMSTNAAFSLVSGLAIAVAPTTVDRWLGVDLDSWIRVIGIVLMGHGIVLGWASRRPDPTSLARLNLAAITPYPIVMVVLVATGLISRPFGQVLALADGAAVTGFAVWHWLSLRRPQERHQPQRV